MKRKVLLVANTASMIKLFNLRNIAILHQLGYEVLVAANFSEPGTISLAMAAELKQKLADLNVKSFDVPFKRGIGTLAANWQAYQIIARIVDQYQVSAIHTHGPLSSIISRQVAHQKQIKCIYTSHGFQFFHHSPLKNWLLFYGIERHFAKYTDALITINADDFQIGKQFSTKHVYYLPGIGTKVKALATISPKHRRQVRDATRAQLGVKDDEFLILSVGELSKRKNHLTVLKAIHQLHNKQIKYAIAGIGPERDALIRYANENGLQDQLLLLGFRKDVQNLYLAADLNAFISLREGLGMGGLEGCILGLYILVSAYTGSKDYVRDEQMGLKIKHPLSVAEVATSIQRVIKDHVVAKPDWDLLFKYDESNVDRLMANIYQKELG